jgi:flagellar biosynthesis protein FlhG
MSTKRNCYEILGVERGASIETVRRAYRRLSTLFEPGNPTLHGLYDEADSGALLAEVRHAYRVLTDPSARQEHDAFLFPDSMRVYTSVELEVDDDPADQAPIDATPIEDTIDGEALSTPVATGGPGRRLKMIRQRLGLSLEDIADRTKIATFTLKCIEDESFRDLPAAIYVRGFLKQIGQILRLENDPLVDEFLDAYDAWRDAKEQPPSF